MTVIAWDGECLAADKRMLAGDTAQSTTKLFRLPDGALVGITGDFCFGLEMVEWLKAGADPATFRSEWRDPSKGGCVLVVRPDRQVVSYESSPIPIPFSHSFCATGSGSLGALVALACGRSASEAVALACMFSSGCGNGVDTLRLEC